MSTTEQRQANPVGIFLLSSGSNLLRRLVKSRVNNLKAVVTQRPGNGLGPTIVAVEPRFRYDDAVRTLHNSETLRCPT